MEVWGGIECTINRVGDDYFDQLDYDNLYERPGLLQRIVDLGIKTFRFPVLWEKVWPDQDKDPDWAVIQHLELLHKNEVRVIAGLVHHGSGPRYAQIQNENFADQLAIYARMVAEKFPWINDYTPINEPLTTARFCGLYGLWHPHSRDNKSFLNILINECRATIMAMKAIREVNPQAKLVLTEDLAKVHGTQKMETQVIFENHRRWLSIDLLCGKVDHTHPLWSYFMQHDIDEDRLHFFKENPMMPDLLGFNYYVTSERYLDHQLRKHPRYTHGHNGQIAYADVEAARHPDAAPAGLEKLMTEAWERYHLPMAITEAHLCCSREDQLRWLKSIWDDCTRLNKKGIPIAAVTFWSLLGAYGWNNLLVKRKGQYESGAFDLGSGLPRKTAITKFIAALAHGQTYHNPVISGRGWWQKQSTSANNFRPILITGTLGEIFARICSERNISCITAEQEHADMSVSHQFKDKIRKHHPWAIVNACSIPGTVKPKILAKTSSIHHIQLLIIHADATITPSYVPQALHAALDLLIDQESIGS